MNEKSTYIRTRISEEDKKELLDKLNKNNLTESDFIRICIANYLGKNCFSERLRFEIFIEAREKEKKINEKKAYIRARVNKKDKEALVDKLKKNNLTESDFIRICTANYLGRNFLSEGLKFKIAIKIDEEGDLGGG